MTFLFTDIEGSTRLLHELGAECYASRLAEHRRVLREAFERHGGVEVDTQGDAFFVAFATAPAALEAACEAQQKLELPVRMGLHTGSPLMTAEGYVGTDVHRAARIAAAGHGRQVLVSEPTAALVRDAVDLTDLGAHRLKDLSAAERIYQLGEAEFPPLKTLYRTNLPVPVTAFVGREQEVAEVASILSGDSRLVTLTGPGGTGKTRLALQAAGALADTHPDGVWWVPLATLREPDLVLDRAAQAVGANDGLAAHVGDQRMLLLLDNFEQLVEAAPRLPELLAACPNLRLLVTSRELLRVQGETGYAVPPLADPEAVELFCARARIEPDETVAELCRRLDNLPLAVELAAARTSVLTPTQIVGRLSGQLDLLKGGRDADPRQQTLRATIEWSHDLLDDSERQLFARLAVFRGGCTLEAAEAVGDADLDILQSLVDKSLVRHTADRFWMLETIRAFALERLRESGEEAELQGMHSEHYLELAEAAHSTMVGNPKPWVDRLEAEHDNLRAALDRLETAGDRERALQMAGALHRFWYMRGHFREGRDRLERLLASGHLATAVGTRALSGAAVMALNHADYPAARRYGDHALALATELGDEWSAAYAEMLLGNVASGEEDYATARQLCERAATRFRALGDDTFARLTSANLGYHLQELGELDRARQVLEAVTREAHEAGEDRNEASARGQLGQVAIEQRRFGDAGPLLVESLRIWAGLGDVTMVARDLRRLARVVAETQRPDAAVRVLSASQRLREEAGQREGWIGRVNEGVLDLVRPELDKATFERAREEGNKLSVREAIKLAQGELGGRGRQVIT